jgi:hypothetical protein
MFAALHSDINSLKSRFFHLIDLTNSQKSRAAKVQDGFISDVKFLGTL